MEASRHQLQHDLKSLAVRVDKTYRWEDLVICVDGYHALIEKTAALQHVVVDAVAVEVAGEEPVSVGVGPIVAEVDHRPDVGVAAAGVEGAGARPLVLSLHPPVREWRWWAKFSIGL